VSIFSTPIFNHTSLNILKVLLTSFRLPPSLAARSGSPDRVPLYCAFAFLGRAAFSTLTALFLSMGAPLSFFFPLHPHQLIFFLL